MRTPKEPSPPRRASDGAPIPPGTRRRLLTAFLLLLTLAASLAFGFAEQLHRRQLETSVKADCRARDGRMTSVAAPTPGVAFQACVVGDRIVRVAAAQSDPRSRDAFVRDCVGRGGTAWELRQPHAKRSTYHRLCVVDGRAAASA